MKTDILAPVQYLKGIGPKKARLFNKIGIKTIEDLLCHFPRRYEDRTNFTAISKLKEGETQTIKAQVLARNVRESFHRRGLCIIEVAVADESGKIFCVWFNQPFLKEYFKVGTSLILYGKVERYNDRLQMNSPEFEVLDSEEETGGLDAGRIVPVYSLPDGLTQRAFRKLIKYALDNYLPKVGECLDYDIRLRNNLLNPAQSLLNIHYPESIDLQRRAYERLSFEEFFIFQAALALRKLRRKEKKGIRHNIEGKLEADFVSSLPFKLTQDQEEVLLEIKSDMAAPRAMQRLLQGDVGSGKTEVALISCLICIQGGYQSAIMVPTEVLARQHYERIKSQCLKATKPQGDAINIALLVSSIEDKEKKNIYRQIAEGAVDLVVGTHALLEERVEFKNLGLVVIDEQHKFGVSQRALLPKKGLNPDVLIMTATPIPRTLAITIYGDLDISVIHSLPLGRKPITTLHFKYQEKQKAYSIVKEELLKGGQAYIVYPVIEESFALDILGAKKMFEELKRHEFKDFRLGLIHGKLKTPEQEAAMLKFKNKELDILISTTVLEVGIDVANASCMAIEHAERFGLSQLHQLRGRVGRGERQSVCILLSELESEEANNRINAMVKYSDGFRIAEEDLRIRGPGEFFGQRQHGLSGLRIANPLSQLRLLKRAREEAIRFVSKDPQLGLRQSMLLKEKLLQRFPEYEKLMLVG
ncbi:MAG: ATP-dependent DNA helicase RecG [Candidatus Omnitrophota bacterium]